MIIVEHPYDGHENLIRHYSDKNKRIEQIETGSRYDEAVDVFPCRYTYIETDEPIPSEPEEQEVEENGEENLH